MGKYKDLVGQKFGRLTVIKDTGKRGQAGTVIWLCKCDCGNEVERSQNAIQLSQRRGHVISCGCYIREMSSRIGKREWWNPKRIERAREGLGQIDGTTMQGINRMKVNKNSTTGYTGVNYSKSANKYRARLMLQGKEINLGFYDKLEDAIKARKDGERKYYDPIREEWEEQNGRKYRNDSV